MTATNYFDQAVTVEAEALRQLVAKGYRMSIAMAAIARARGVAHQYTKHLGVSIRGQAFLETLQYELRTVEDWAKRTTASAT